VTGRRRWWWVGAVAAVWPGEPTASPELRRAIRFLAGGATPGQTAETARTVVAAGYVAAICAGTVAVGVVSLAWVTVGVPAWSVAGPAVVGLGVAHTVHRAPVWLATFRRTRALGATATVVGLVVVRLRLGASPERAAAFAGRTGEGPLAASLARHADAARATPGTGLDEWADDWRPWFPALDRSVALLLAAADAPPGLRERTLDRAVAAVGDAVETRAASFAASIRGPVTALYAGGVLLPLALVGAVPAASVAGLPVGPVGFLVVYDLLLPAAVVIASAWILLDRPVAFPPPRLPRDHPALPSTRRRSALAGVTGATAGWLAATVAVGGWAGPPAAVGFGCGSTLLARFRPTRSLRARVTELERGLPDALALVGRRVAGGTAVERAVDTAGERLPGPVGEAFAAASRRRQTLGVDVERAFCGECGPFVRTPTATGRAAATLLAVAAGAGTPAGELLTTEAERLDTLRDHERRARRAVATVTDTLEQTAALFGPLVGGATVALASGLDGLSAASAVGDGEPLSAATVGSGVGVYVLVLAVTLPTLAVGLRAGLDRSRVGYRVGRSLVTAQATFLAAAWVTGLLV
jgi:Flp pilus assembly protein TadB